MDLLFILSEKYELVSMKLLYELVLTAASRAGSHEFGIPSIQHESKIKITQIPRSLYLPCLKFIKIFISFDFDKIYTVERSCRELFRSVVIFVIGQYLIMLLASETYV